MGLDLPCTRPTVINRTRCVMNLDKPALLNMQIMIVFWWLLIHYLSDANLGKGLKNGRFLPLIPS